MTSKINIIKGASLVRKQFVLKILFFVVSKKTFSELIEHNQICELVVMSFIYLIQQNEMKHVIIKAKQGLNEVSSAKFGSWILIRSWNPSPPSSTALSHDVFCLFFMKYHRLSAMLLYVDVITTWQHRMSTANFHAICYSKFLFPFIFALNYLVQ